MRESGFEQGDSSLEVFRFGAGLEVYEESGFWVFIGFSFFVGICRDFGGVHGCLLWGFGKV